MLFSLLLGSVLLLGRQDAVADSAHIVANRVVLDTLGVSFETPEAWMLAAAGLPHPVHSCVDGPSVRPTFATTPGELRALGRPTAGYDVEYAEVLDTLVAFDRLVAHLGTDQWGSTRCWNGLSVRVYVLSAADAPIPERAAHVLVHTAYGRTGRPLVTTVDSAGWSLTRVEWTPPHGDLIATLRVDVLTRTLGGRTLAIAFMYIGEDAAAKRAAMLASYRTGTGGPPSRSPSERIEP